MSANDETKKIPRWDYTKIILSFVIEWTEIWPLTLNKKLIPKLDPHQFKVQTMKIETKIQTEFLKDNEFVHELKSHLLSSLLFRDYFISFLTIFKSAYD